LRGRNKQNRPDVGKEVRTQHTQERGTLNEANATAMKYGLGDAVRRLLGCPGKNDLEAGGRRHTTVQIAKKYGTSLARFREKSRSFDCTII